MSEHHAPEPQQDPEIDPGDAAIAWNFGTRELTPDEYDRFADYNRRDLDRVYAQREADAEYAAWKQANPEAAAQAVAEFEAKAAGSWARSPLLTPEFAQAIHEAGGWLGYEADRTPEPEPKLEAGL
jgi:MoxR-like ATPase